ncbi:hypothetical protein ACLRDC_07175 [Gluconacetobacter sacchari]|uniref:Uncharacterized protein n=1 Tax=Gluconacetobacter sacchari TaxID=92759 RepID=A0A7W4NNE2_9PROT|nr:hypothetical protein [Gluconacetobacter sacchari]MBB2161021.1 hypothetical protein [Gluconacetobacter sacchari]
MVYAAGIIGHILIRDWIATRRPACAADRHGRSPTSPRRVTWTGDQARSRPGYVASMRQMSADLSRRVAFRRQR